MREDILVIAAHPDDEVLGCGGTIVRHVAEGQKVSVLIVSRGAPGVFPDEQVKQVREELSEAHLILGISQTYFLDFPAPKLDSIPGYQLAQQIGEVIQAVRPAIVYFPHRGDIHGDHQAVYQATLVASRPINNNPVRKLLCYETLSETEWATPIGSEWFIPTLFMDISDHLELKLKAMACYKSQLKSPPHPRSLETITALATYRGNTVNLIAAEAFMLIREVI